MPTYEFICSACQKTFEKQLKIADRELPINQPCPECKAEGTVARHYGNTSIEWSDPWQLGRKKPPSDWREFINKLKKDNPGATNIRDY